MPNLKDFPSKEKRNEYYRAYRKKNLKKLREYHKLKMREYRAKKNL